MTYLSPIGVQVSWFDEEADDVGKYGVQVEHCASAGNVDAS